MGIFEDDGDVLGGAEKSAGCDEAPEAAGVVLAADVVGADAGEEAAAEAAEGEDGDVHALRAGDEAGRDVTVRMFPQRDCYVADIVDGHQADACQEPEEAENEPEAREVDEGPASDVQMPVVGRLALELLGGLRSLQILRRSFIVI